MNTDSDSSDEVKKLYTVADLILEKLLAFYKEENGGIHAETVIGAVAALTGEWALRATGQPLPSEGFVVGVEINAKFFEGEEPVWPIIQQGALHAGLNESELPDVIEVVARTAAHLGDSQFPPLSLPEQHYPREWSPVAAPRFRGIVEETSTKHGLAADKLYLACGIATAKLIVFTKDVLEPKLAVQLALDIMVGVSRMAPLPAEPQGKGTQG